MRVREGRKEGRKGCGRKGGKEGRERRSEGKVWKERGRECCDRIQYMS